jgi:foldase protein PrsA
VIEDAAKWRFFMTRRHVAVVLLALLALLAAGCGGESPRSVSADAVAQVGDDEISKAEFDRVLGQAKRGYAQQKRSFPKPGSADYEQLKGQIVQFLVQRSQFEQRAEDMDIDVSDKQVQQRLAQVKKQYFGGNDKRYRKQLAQQGLSEQQLRSDIRAQLVSEAIFKQVTGKVQVDEAQIRSYYGAHRKQYTQPESREVRHILVKSKALANRLYRRLQAGASFAKLARRYSEDPGSKAQGGKLTVAKGQTVAPFDQTAFLLGTGTISRPVKTQYGYHIIQPLSAVKPERATPLAQVKSSIRQQLLQTKKNEAMSAWVEETRKQFEDKTSYQVGYRPPATTTGSTQTATGSTQ